MHVQAIPTTHTYTLANKCTNTHTHTHRPDSHFYCSHFYGGPISLLLPFVLRIISLHGMGGFQLSHFLLLSCMSPVFIFLPFFFFSLSFCLSLWLSFSLPSLYSSWSSLEVVQRSASTDRWSKTPEVFFPSLRWPPFLLHFLYVLFLSLSPAPFLSVLPECLARRTMLDLSVLSALCIWMALCARLGQQPGVSVCVGVWPRAGVCVGLWICVCVCVLFSLLANVIMHLKLAWLFVTQSATHKFLPFCRDAENNLS